VSAAAVAEDGSVAQHASGPSAAEDQRVDVTRGLTPAQVHTRVLAGQVNTSPPAPGRTIGQILRANLFTRFNAILGSLFVVVAIVGPPQDALFGVVLAANTVIGVIQELRAKRTLDRLAILTAPQARVVREGVAAELPVQQVVLDDVLELRPGDQVAVDAVVLRSDGLELDEALLSGEAEPVAKNQGDRALSGSFVGAGTGIVQAVGVGESAYAAALQAQARRFSLIRSELQQGTNQILRLVTWVMVPAGLLLVVSQLFRSHEGLADALRGSVAGVGAMVPEGLVLLTSIAFAVGALRLARRRVLVQELAAIEGLARVDVLCIDKTGTLTAPGMHLDGIELVSAHQVAEVQHALGAIAAADPAPNATMRALAERCPAPTGWAVISRVPFSSARKWSAVSFAGRGTWILGAPDVLGGLPAAAAAAAARHQAEGRRVLLLASTPGPADAAGPPGTLTPVALLLLAERLRDDAAATVRYLLDQDITIKVLSGDAPQTVSAIADRAGVPRLGAPRDAAEMGDGDTLAAAALAATNVIGRVRPEQKLAAVRALQADGHVVAMVGDGVNDVQALKQADLGIAMGSGSQSSRSVARIVLLDSTFAAVPQVLAEGRRVIANIERVARLFVTKTVYAAILAVVIGLAGLPFPFFPRHLTIISTLTIGIPGFFLALAAGAPRARPGFTQRVLAFTIPAGIAAAAATLATYAIARAAPGTTAPATTGAAARTAAMLALFALGLWVLALTARPLSGWRIALVAAAGGALGLLFALPLGRRIFTLQFPPATVTLAMLGVVILAIIALTLWRRFAPQEWARRGA
jgi:cation-transporting ATPase E